ncbi:unnamed protein product [Nippostrongylus brasiliensis]|uniref:Neuropeptide-like 4 n=1 Tax=Nippostrongylus brasiliensis TaxID=27835 RepID=A0A0N4Y9D7_NIPBR|nr:hypothetical protein Q1695_005244 [Nippostrongylus brasiliensis]VDL76497.1 unnamed protein product [Nippostrongylus brasiliensis]
MNPTLLICVALLSITIGFTDAQYGYYTRTTYYYGRPYLGPRPYPLRPPYRPVVRPAVGAVGGAIVGAISGAMSGK